jgi:GNAT superfamily N-acetyltransferase
MEFPRNQPKVEFKLAKPEDVALWVNVFGPHYFHEANFHHYSELDLPHAVEIISEQIKSQSAVFILAYIEDQPVGCVSYTLDRVFTRKPIAYLNMIYVVPRARRGALGRMLLVHAMHLAQGDGACAFFATIPPDTRIGRRLCNMFRRGGFVSMAGAFMRRL